MAVKDRMIYSTAKSPLLGQIEQEIGIEIAKKVGVCCVGCVPSVHNLTT